MIENADVTDPWRQRFTKKTSVWSSFCFLKSHRQPNAILVPLLRSPTATPGGASTTKGTSPCCISHLNLRLKISYFLGFRLFAILCGIERSSVYPACSEALECVCISRRPLLNGVAPSHSMICPRKTNWHAPRRKSKPLVSFAEKWGSTTRGQKYLQQ